MSTNLVFVSGIFSLVIIIFILYLIRQENVNIKYSLVWLLLIIILLMCLFVTGLLNYITKVLGYQTACFSYY